MRLKAIDYYIKKILVDKKEDTKKSKNQKKRIFKTSEFISD